MTYSPIRLEGLPLELERDLLPIIPRNLRIVSSGVKSSPRWLPVWEFDTRRPTPSAVPPSMELGQRDTPCALLNVVFSFVLSQPHIASDHLIWAFTNRILKKLSCLPLSFNIAFEFACPDFDKQQISEAFQAPGIGNPRLGDYDLVIMRNVLSPRKETSGIPTCDVGPLLSKLKFTDPEPYPVRVLRNPRVGLASRSSISVYVWYTLQIRSKKGYSGYARYKEMSAEQHALMSRVVIATKDHLSLQSSWKSFEQNIRARSWEDNMPINRRPK
uniref:Uncharacterized protein n=1 Tax=Tanacetum cinerariifolium TaxID=118510 RepID=A0A699GMX2_TANCI|nr:hypothetical protein [Tanacetum cinerariifolium]